MGVGGWRRPAAVAGSLILALAAAEAALRLLAPVRTLGIGQTYEYDSLTGYRLKPGMHLTSPEDVHTNALGTANYQESFRDYQRLVFAIGDSFTQGSEAPADAAYPFQLDLILNRDETGQYVKRYGVVNLGTGGFGGEQSMLALRRCAAAVGKPAFVLYLGAENDYEDDELFRGGRRRHHLVDGSQYWGRMLGPVRWAVNTQLGMRLQLATAQWRRLRAMSATPGAVPESKRAGRSSAELQRPVLERIAALSQEYGAALVVSWAESPPGSYDWLRSWARERGIGFADWAPAAASVRRAIPAAPFAYGGGHPRGWVNRLIAEGFARQVVAAGR